MARHQKLWARRARATLMVELGNLCRECGDTRDLTFDCIISLGHLHHTMDPSARMCFYHKQHRLQNLQILCRRCNGRKGYAERMAWENTIAEQPF